MWFGTSVALQHVYCNSYILIQQQTAKQTLHNPKACNSQALFVERYAKNLRNGDLQIFER
jgi:hypothetical protein